MTKKNLLFVSFFLVVLVIMFICYFFVRDVYFLADEHNHYLTIKEISSFSINQDTFSRNAQLPGYYFLMAFISNLLGFSSLASMRLTNTVLSFFSIIIFYLLAQKINPHEAISKTAQYFFFPLIFVFFFLVYSDIFSLFLLMSSFLSILNKKYKIAGFLGFLSVLVRQNNVIWLGFFCLYIFLEEYKFNLRKDSLIRYFKDISVFIFSFLAVVIYILVNKSPAMTEPSLNPFAFRQENLFFLLFLYFFLFFPLTISNLPKAYKLLKKYPYFIVLVFVVFAYYLAFFKVDHWYNNPVYFDYFLRNRLVNYAVENLTQKIIFFIPVAFSILTLFVAYLYRKSYYLLYPFAFLFLSLSWLIEPRYTIIPFVFFLLFKKDQSSLVEYSTLMIYILFTIWVFWGTFTQAFFL